MSTLRLRQSLCVRLGAAALVLISACSSRQPAASPYTAAETNEALAPAKQLRARCYDSSALGKAKKKIVLDFKLEVEPAGTVRAIPVFVEPDEPEIIECVRHVLNEIKFPARGRDRLDLHFEMGH